MALTKRQLAEEMESRAARGAADGQEVDDARLAFDLDAQLVRENISDRVPGKNPIKVTCQCDPPRTIRVFPTVLGDGPIICGMCDGDFE